MGRFSKALNRLTELAHRRLGGLRESSGRSRARHLGVRSYRLEWLEERALLSIAGMESAPAGTFYTPPSQQMVEMGSYLTERSVDTPLGITVDFLRGYAADLGLAASDLDNFVVTDQYVSGHTGVTHIYLGQTYRGLEVVGAEINANVTADGQLINVGSSFVPGLAGMKETPSLQPTLSAAGALQTLAADFGWELDVAPVVISTADDLAQTTLLAPRGASREQIPAELVFVPAPGGGVELAWNLLVEGPDGEHVYDASVSAGDGEVLHWSDLVAADSYRVYELPKENPDDGGMTLVVDPAHPTASPYAWHDTDGAAGAEYTVTRGNNVYAYADRNDDNAPDPGSSPDGGAPLVFDFVINLGQQPVNYQDAAVTNLFYWNNILHDVHYQYGFDEASGNFQVDNYGNGGLGGDAVRAEAQDGADVGNSNNAYFLTPRDGSQPRMQMYVFDNTTPWRDGDLDNGIIIHEYGHGVSNRLTGGPGDANALNAVQSGGMGEGWSDWWALMLTQQPGDGQFDAYPIGTYAIGQLPTGSGIRRFPYNFNMAVNPLTYGNFNTSNKVHDAGEIWASALWDLNWLLINGGPGLPPGRGFDPDLYGGSGGNNLALQLVMDGLKLQPANPSFLDGRDAILSADQVLTGGANQWAIWTAFARRGMGFSADDGGGGASVTVAEAFDLPSTSEGIVAFDADNYEIGQTVTISVRDLDLNGGGPINVSLVSSGGDSETVNLAELGLGVFEGSIPTAAGAAVPGNGTLQVAAGNVITVTYNDADDGTGNSAVVTDTARIVVFCDVFTQDFEAGLGANETVSGAFRINGTNAPLNNGTLMMGHPGDYANNEYSYYELTVDLGDYTGAEMLFDYAGHIEDYYDGFNVQAATGPIAPPNNLISPISGLPYDEQNPGPDYSPRPEIGPLAYDSDEVLNTGSALFDLSAFDGQIVNIRFQFGSDESLRFPGINFDNLLIRAACGGTEEITVLGNGEEIVDGDITPSRIDGTDFGSVGMGLPGPASTFTVRNDGSEPLILGAVILPAGYILEEGLDANVPENGGSDTFTVRLDSGTPGIFGGEVSFSNNDDDESPYNFAITGQVLIDPEIIVLGNGQEIVDGDSTPSPIDGTDFGSVALGQAAGPFSDFTVRNEGGQPLTLGAVILPAGYILEEGLDATVPPGGFDTFTVRLDTSTLGTFSGDISFSNNDSDEDPYNFAITGEVVTLAPRLDLDADDSSGATGNDFATGFTAGGGPVPIADADATLVDVDTPTLASLTVAIINLQDAPAELLDADVSGTAIGKSYDAANGILTLSGVDTLSNYQQVLRTISYDNTAYPPGVTARTIGFVANDGTFDSDLAIATVGIVAPAKIGGNVWQDDGNGIQDPGEPGVPGAAVELFEPGADAQPGGGDDVSLGVLITDDQGEYTFEGIMLGLYYLSFRPPPGYGFTILDAGDDDTLDSDADPNEGPTGGRTGLFAAVLGQRDDTRDAGLIDAPPGFGWVADVGTLGWNEALSVATYRDKNGRVFVYATGYFQGTADFDPADGQYNLQSVEDANGPTEDVYLAKYTSQGALVWARAMGGDGEDKGRGLAVDGAGSAYFTGRFSTTAEFGTDPASPVSLDSHGGKDVFVAKMDPSGQLDWVKRMGGAGEDLGAGIALDGDRGVYVSGLFEGFADFSGSDSPLGTRFSAGGSDAFVSKLDSSGDFEWARTVGADARDMANAIAADGLGNVYITGSFSRTVDFDPSGGLYELTPVGDPGKTDVFVWKLDASGSFDWARRMGGDNVDWGLGIAAAGGNVYTTGFVYGPADFDFDESPDSVATGAPGTRDAFVSKFDDAGNYVWSRRTGGDLGLGVAVDASDNVYTIGYFKAKGDFDPADEGSYLLASEVDVYGDSTDDLFVSKLDDRGRLAWSRRVGGAGRDLGRGIALYESGLPTEADYSCDVYVAGFFQDTVDFDPSGSASSSVAAAERSAFVSRWQQRDVGGTVWNDVDGDGTRDDGEPGIDDVTVTLYIDDDDGDYEPGDGDGLVGTQTTAEEGAYVFTNLAPGRYWVHVDRQSAPLAGWEPTGPAYHRVDLLGDLDSGDENFGFEPPGDNLPPVITLPGGPLDYTENGGPVAIDAAAMVQDPDSPNFYAGVFTVQLTLGGTAADRLAIRHQGSGPGQIGVAGDQVTYGGTVIATFTGGSDGATPLVVRLNGNAGPAALQALAPNVTYENLSEDPSTTDRTVEFVLSDGDGGTSDPVTKIIRVSSVNDPPLLEANLGLVLHVGTGAVIGEDLLRVTDLDDTPAELEFTLQAPPLHGTLRRDGVTLQPGATFTQQDVEANLLSYLHDNSDTSSDEFTFTLSDASGAGIAQTAFPIAVRNNLAGDAFTDEGEAYTLTVDHVAEFEGEEVQLVIIRWGDNTNDTTFDPRLPQNTLPKDLVHVYDDGPAEHGITATLATLFQTFEDVDTISVTVGNVSPDGRIFNAGDVDEGTPGQVEFGGQFDPSAADTAAGFFYSYDFNNDGDFADPGEVELQNTTESSATVPAVYLADGPGSRTVRGRIADKDGGSADFTTTITVNAVAPSVFFDTVEDSIHLSPGVPFSLDGYFTDSGDDGWTATVDFGDGAGPQALPLEADKTFTLDHVFTSEGSYQLDVVVTDVQDGLSGSSSIWVVVIDDTMVVGRYVFYDNSAFAGDAAIAPTPQQLLDGGKDPKWGKQALRPGETATFQNYTTYGFGLNGIVVDISNLPAETTQLTAADFQFRVGNSSDLGTWSDPAVTPAPENISLDTGGAGPARATITWADNDIRNQWLEVTVKATAATGLTSDDVFYFGNTAGEVGNTFGDADPNALVTYADLIQTRNNISLTAEVPIENGFDFNRDKFVTYSDLILCRNNLNLTSGLELISAPLSLDAAGAMAAIATFDAPWDDAAGTIRQTAAFDAALEQPLKREPLEYNPSLSELTWMPDYLRLVAGNRSSRNDNSAETAVDMLMATWP